MKAYITAKGAYAFTLAEVLITLGIIGIVAALTMPTIINKSQDKIYIIKDFDCDKDYMYSILVKYVKGVRLSKNEVDDLGHLLVSVVNCIQERISYPFNHLVKNYILSILKYC